MSVARSGLPTIQDVLGQYRLHVDRIADGEEPRPHEALLVEQFVDGSYTVHTFGMTEHPTREKVAAFARNIGVLSGALAGLNAQAGN